MDGRLPPNGQQTQKGPKRCCLFGPRIRKTGEFFFLLEYLGAYTNIYQTITRIYYQSHAYTNQLHAYTNQLHAYTNNYASIRQLCAFTNNYAHIPTILAAQGADISKSTRLHRLMITARDHTTRMIAYSASASHLTTQPLPNRSFLQVVTSK
jgi:hypothetical protein